MAVDQLVAATGQAEAEHLGLAAAKQVANFEFKIQQVVYHHGQSDHERLANLVKTPPSPGQPPGHLPRPCTHLATSRL